MSNRNRSVSAHTRFIDRPPLHTSALVYCALQVTFLSFLFSYYSVHPGNVLRPVADWTFENLQKIPFVQNSIDKLEGLVKLFSKDNASAKVQRKATKSRVKGNFADHLRLLSETDNSLSLFTAEQLSLFDGSRPSKGTYLAILGRVYDVTKGSKHYGPGGGYHFFSGRDATRAFVSGDFSEEGLVDDVDGLSSQDYLGIYDWIKFYENDYQLVGYLKGTYYDSNHQPTAKLKDVVELIKVAQQWKDASAEQAKIFPPCNSEWRKETGGRIWCSRKSGGVERDWSGVPRKFFDQSSKAFRCVCVKNFGPPMSVYPGVDKNGGHGDLDNPNLKEYDGCNPTSITCKNDDS